jgi:hypothetical protein
LVLWDSTFRNAINPILDLKWTNFTSEPTFVYTHVTRLNTTVDGAPTSYSLSCAGNFSGQDPQVVGGGFRDNRVTFTIQNGAQKPDLMAATANSASCANTSHFAFNLTGTLDVNPAKYDGRNTCAVLSDVQPRVSGNPCAVHVDSTTASSISAALTASACAAISPVVSCPSKRNAAAGGWNAAKTGFPAVLGGFVAALVAKQLLWSRHGLLILCVTFSSVSARCSPF